MDTPNIVVPPGRDPVSPGRSFSLKLRGGETDDSIMMFEETIPAGTKSTFHLHHDSDEVAYVLSGEITFKIGDEVTVGGPGTCAFPPIEIQPRPLAPRSTGTCPRASPAPCTRRRHAPTTTRTVQMTTTTAEMTRSPQVSATTG